MKKFFAILVAALLVVACGGNAKKEPKSVEDQLLEQGAKMEQAMKAEANNSASSAWDDEDYDDEDYDDAWADEDYDDEDYDDEDYDDEDYDDEDYDDEW